MRSYYHALVLLLLTAGPALAATAPQEAVEAERAGPLAIIIFVVVFVALTVGMVAIAFLRKGGKGEDDKPNA